MNNARIVRNKNRLYLEVSGKPLNNNVYFIIENYSTKNILNNNIALTKTFNIDLKAKEE